MNNTIELKSIQNLLGMNFFIPSYQRGYRWTKQQVEDLLNDIWEFQNKDVGEDEIYCIQPLVVKDRKEDSFKKIKEEATSIEDVKKILKGSWEVIDGQQRLTTIYILLSYLDSDLENKYSIEYETRKKNPNSTDVIKKNVGSKEFLENIKKGHFDGINKSVDEIAKSNIDYHHMNSTYQTINNWFKNTPNKDKETFLSILKEKVQFIWYESDETDPIKVFTRLNIGKIALTDAELIKAIFLNKSNFGCNDNEQVRLQQVEIASEWDKIEYTLQNDEFWLFIHDIGWSKPTRIDFIFDMMREKDEFGLKELLREGYNGTDFNDWYNKKIGNDEHQTFRYFYEYFKQKKTEINAAWLRKTWHTIKEYFQIFEEWYNDLELYHYVGFLILHKTTIFNIKDLYVGDKELFRNSLVDLIKRKLGYVDLNQDFGENGEYKTKCRPILILHNIQTVINQNKELVGNKKYGLGTFYKFPFHLFKKEAKKVNGKGWEVEHIASNSGDDFESIKNQKSYLASIVYCLKDGDLKTDIENFLDDKVGKKDFMYLFSEIRKLNISHLEGIEKQKIWNYALLDSSTNEEYQNDPFPIKRICILAKEQGHKARVYYDENTKRLEIDRNAKAIAFVPPCTKNVFIKAYTDIPTSLSAWTKDDAKSYLQNIEQVMMEFIYPDIYAIPEKYRPALNNRIICLLSKGMRERYIAKIKNFINKSYNHGGDNNEK